MQATQNATINAMKSSTLALWLTFTCHILGAVGHPEYLKDCPAVTDSYFSQWGVGAVGHDGGRAGASLNPFGESFRHAKANNCAVLDEDDDDDDDDHHGGWGTKLCCADSDGDGLTNGAELGGKHSYICMFLANLYRRICKHPQIRAANGKKDANFRGKITKSVIPEWPVKSLPTDENVMAF